MTRLKQKVERVTAYRSYGKPGVVSLAPLGSQTDARIAVRLLGERTYCTGLVSDLYRVLALWHAPKIAKAKAQARRDGVPWRIAKKAFLRSQRP
jgi:hypothetical protein